MMIDVLKKLLSDDESQRVYLLCRKNEKTYKNDTTAMLKIIEINQRTKTKSSTNLIDVANIGYNQRIHPNTSRRQ
jgi:hypothetical protein